MMKMMRGISSDEMIKVASDESKMDQQEISTNAAADVISVLEPAEVAEPITTNDQLVKVTQVSDIEKKIIIDADKDNYISLSLKDGEVTDTEVISKKEPKAYIKGASVLDKLDRKKQTEIDRELIDKSYGIAQKIKEIRSGNGSGSANSVGEEIKESIATAQKEYEKKLEEAKKKMEAIVIKPEAKKIMDALESEEFKSNPVTFKENGATMNLMEELKEEAEKDFEDTWKENTEPANETVEDILKANQEIVTYGGKRDKEIEFQDGVTEKEQQILDIVSETPIDQLAESEAFLKKIGEYKNLMKSKMTKFEASKKVKDKLNQAIDSIKSSPLEELLSQMVYSLT
jgi:hypothetical protein